MILLGPLGSRLPIVGRSAALRDAAGMIKACGRRGTPVFGRAAELRSGRTAITGRTIVELV